MQSKTIYSALCTVILLASVALSAFPQHDTVTAQEGNRNFPITITDATGREVTIESVDRIISGSGDITEIVVALGLQDNLVGVDISSTYPEDVLDSVPAFGFARRLTLEPIVTLDPTVFLCVQTCMPEVVLDQLRDFNIPVVILPDGDDVDLTLPIEKIRMAAAALGVPERGEDIAMRVEREIGWARTATANVEREPYVLLLYFRGSRLQLVYGANTPAEALIEGAGGIEAAGEIGVDGYIPLSTEILLTAFPDYILLMESGVESAGGLDVVRNLQGMSQTPAGQQDNFLVYDDQYLLALSIRTGQMLLDLSAQLHADMTWERDVTYPYTVEDVSGTMVTVESDPMQIVVSDTFYQTVAQLGFHPERLQNSESTGLYIVSADDDVEALRSEGKQVIVLNANATISEIATALNVPGRGEALTVQRSLEQE